MGDIESEAMNTKRIRHLQSLSEDERRAFLDSFDRIFCDCDGVIWETVQTPIPGAGKAINYLKDIGKDIVFVTNNSLRLVEDHLSKLEENGVSATKEQLVHPAQSVVNYLNDLNFEGLIYCIASTPFKQTLTSAGFDLIDGPNRMLDETIKDLCENVFTNDPVMAVVIDVDFNLSVAKLMRAHNYLKNPDCLFLAGSADSLIPVKLKDIIGPGPFIQVLEQSTKRQATILGKPGRGLSDFLKKQCNVVDPGRVLFIGDSLRSDVKFGKMSGFKTLLVQSEWTKKNRLLEKVGEDETPDYYIDTLAELNDFV